MQLLLRSRRLGPEFAPRGRLASKPPTVSHALGLVLVLAVVALSGSVAAAERGSPTERAAAAVAKVRRAPLSPAAWCRAGDALLAASDPHHALAAYEEARRLDPLGARARGGRARALLALERPDEAWAAIGWIRAPTLRDQRTGLLALVGMGRHAQAQQWAERALRRGPDDAQVTEAAARAAYRRGDMPRARVLYIRATELDPAQAAATLRLGSGFGPWIDGPLWRDANERRAFDAATRAWRQGEREDARDLFAALVRRRPSSFKHRLGLGTVLREQRHRSAGPFGGDAPFAYALLPAPAAKGEATLIPGFEELPSAQRHALRVALAPLRPWLPALLAAGARHDVLPMAANLTDHAERRAWHTQPTFDGRWYAHLRGCGGQYAATGEEKLRSATYFGFNTFAHELAHQILTHALSPDQRAEIHKLYERALEEGCCLDHYAASNVDEYFAQGYEAFLSHDKRTSLRKTARHTRHELKQRDQRLYAFFQRHLDLRHEAGAALMPYRTGVEMWARMREMGAAALLRDAQSGALLSFPWPPPGPAPTPR